MAWLLALKEKDKILIFPPHPEQCSNYTMLDSSIRNYQNTGQNDCDNGPCCDTYTSHRAYPDWKGPGWYRVGGQAGTQLNEKGTGVWNSCGTYYGGWLSGGHPTREEREVSRTVYFENGGGDRANPTSIKVINCNNKYFVYYLSTAFCYSGYCTK